MCGIFFICALMCGKFIKDFFFFYSFLRVLWNLILRYVRRGTVIKNVIVNVIGVRVSEKKSTLEEPTVYYCVTSVMARRLDRTDAICLGSRKIGFINTGCRPSRAFCIGRLSWRSFNKTDAGRLHKHKSFSAWRVDKVRIDEPFKNQWDAKLTLKKFVPKPCMV